MAGGFKLAVVGPWGRMGRRVVDLAKGDADIALYSVLLRTHDPKDQRLEILPTGCIITDDFDQALVGADALIDFSAPAICGSLAPKCAEHEVAYVVASTGLTGVDLNALDTAANRTPVLEAANLSFGVTVLTKLVEAASRALSGFDVEICEIHHKSKRDAASGTAYALGKAVHAGRAGLQDITGRCGDAPRKENELGYASMRGGDVSGEHTVFFLGEGERIELTHRSTTPNIFASGALRAAKWLVGQAPGRYSMHDVIG